jgi:hypothetical protein
MLLLSLIFEVFWATLADKRKCYLASRCETSVSYIIWKYRYHFRDMYSRAAILDSIWETKKRNRLLMHSTSFGSAHVDKLWDDQVGWMSLSSFSPQELCSTWGCTFPSLCRSCWQYELGTGWSYRQLELVSRGWSCLQRVLLSSLTCCIVSLLMIIIFERCLDCSRLMNKFREFTWL